MADVIDLQQDATTTVLEFCARSKWGSIDEAVELVADDVTSDGNLTRNARTGIPRHRTPPPRIPDAR